MAGTAELASKLAGDFNITIASAKKMAVTVLDYIVDIAKDERIRVGRHTFKPYTRAARKGRNLHTGESIDIPEKKGIKYKYIPEKDKEVIADPISNKKKTASKKK